MTSGCRRPWMLWLLAFLLGGAGWRSAVSGALTEQQERLLGQPCIPFADDSPKPTVMVVGQPPAAGGVLLHHLRHHMKGSLKLLHKGPPVEMSALCMGDRCEMDLGDDVCAQNYASVPFAELQGMLKGAQVVLHFAPSPARVTDIMAQEKLLQVVTGNASAYLYIVPARPRHSSSIEQALVDQALDRKHRTKTQIKVVRLFDVYGPEAEVDDTRPSIVPHLIRQALEKDALSPPPHAKQLFDFVYASDVAAALHSALQLPHHLSDIDVATGQITSMWEAMHILQQLAAKCLHRTLQVPVLESIRPQKPEVAFNASHAWLAHWKAHVTPWQGFAATMRQTLADLGNRSAAPAGVDVTNATACLDGEAHHRGRIAPHFTLAAQLGHPILCTPPEEQPAHSEEKKTLVVSIGLVRAHRLTWHTFEREVFNPQRLGGPVDLAIASPSGFEAEGEKATNHFFQKAKYVWEVHNPPSNNYRHYFNEIARACFNRSFSAYDASVIGNRFKGNFLGLITEAKHEWGGAALLFFKWLALQQMLHLRLLSQYRFVILTRSDFVWTGPHPSLESLQPKHVLIPTGSDWDGINDRHMAMTSQDAPHILSLCERIIDRPGQRVIDSMLAQDFRPGAYNSYNSECYLRWWLAIHSIHADRFPNRAYIVWDRQQPGSTGGFHRPLEPRPAKLMVIPKYMEEYEEATRNAA